MLAAGKEKPMRITSVVPVAVAALLHGTLAQAAARVVVLPVVVGSGPEPSAPLMGALSRGIQENGPWTVVQGDALKGLMVTAIGIKPEDRTRIAGKLDDVARLLQKRSTTEALAALEPTRTEIAQAMRDYTFENDDFALAYRAAGLHVAALLAAGEADRGKAAATETQTLFPGRKPTEADRLPTAAVQALNAAAPEGSVRLTLRSRPDACEVLVAGTSVGRSPVELPAVPGAIYQAQAVCGGGTEKSYTKRIAVGDKDTARQEILDADFERAFAADGGQRLRFASSPERRQLEESSARRVAERYGADVVVLASVGELSGADWLNGRLYLRSGYLNRQALVRLENTRAFALGRYLATGRDVPGVLKPEEAGALVAAAASNDAGAPASKVDPWYTDIVGWCFTGVGALGVTLGLIWNSSASKTTDRADRLRPCTSMSVGECGDSEAQQALYRDAQRSKFMGGIGLVGGGLMAITGVVLLAIPEYSSSQGELFVFSPTPGGATLGLRGRF
jgi:hypothetical protein